MLSVGQSSPECKDFNNPRSILRSQWMFFFFERIRRFLSGLITLQFGCLTMDDHLKIRADQISTPPRTTILSDFIKEGRIALPRCDCASSLTGTGSLYRNLVSCSTLLSRLSEGQPISRQMFCRSLSRKCRPVLRTLQALHHPSLVTPRCPARLCK
jgi:hypothetical protein